MNRCLAVLTAFGALLLAAGCGSSKSTSSTSTASIPQTGLKVSTTPKYATPSSSAPVQSGVVQISYHNISIHPDTVKVKVGSTIKWTNTDEVIHNVTSQGSGPAKIASKDLHTNATFEFKVTKAGTIHYECTFHPASMNGTITVVK
jgi:plastocyanin